MPLGYEEQTKYRYHGKLLTVTEIAKVSGLGRSYIYSKLERLFKLYPLMKTKEIGRELDNKTKVGLKRYKINNYFLTPTQIAYHFRLPYPRTKMALHRGKSIESILSVHRGSIGISSLSPELLDALQKAYNFFQEQYANRLSRLPEIEDLETFARYVGVPKSPDDYFWVEAGSGLQRSYFTWVEADRERFHALGTVGMEQQRRGLTVDFDGEKVAVSALAERFGISKPVLRYRVNAGWPQERWFETPR